MITKDSQSYRMMALVAMSGECSENAMMFLMPQESYRIKIIQNLFSDNLISRYEGDGVKGYRLTRHGKDMLLQMYEARFSFFLSDGADFNLRSSKLVKRLRQHRISEVIAMMQSSGIEIYRDRKNLYFEQISEQSEQNAQSAFFHSKEVKAQLELTRKIINSKLTGVWVSGNTVWFCYHMGNELLLWYETVENRADILIRSMLSKSGITDVSSGAVLFGNHMLQAAMCLADHKSKVYIMNSPFKRFCFVPLTEYGSYQLRILEDIEMEDYLISVLTEDLKPVSEDAPIECNGYNDKAEPVLICTDMDLKRLARFIVQLQYNDSHGEVICFDYQREAIEDFCEGKASITEVDFAAIKEALFDE